MKSKKALMGYAAILILLFHLYVPFGQSLAEAYLYRCAYIGVDLFFFVSAYGLGKKQEIRWLDFYKNRLISTYVPFVLFALMAMCYKGWRFTRFLTVIFGINFVQKGGGAFLWFIPGIILCYLVVPGMHRLKTRFGLISGLWLLLAWLVLVVVCQYVFGYTTLMILLNRIPIFLIGFYMTLIEKHIPGKWSWLLIGIGLILGVWLTWTYGFRFRLQKPVADMYYVLAIPLILSILGLAEVLYGHMSRKPVPLEWIGGITLELYAFQMIYGFDLENLLVGKLHKPQLAFVCTLLLLMAGAWVWHLAYGCLTRFLAGNQRKTHKE